jgi:hypothetical protein
VLWWVGHIRATLQVVCDTPIGDIEHTDRSIATSGGQVLAVGAEPHTEDLTGVVGDRQLGNQSARGSLVFTECTDGAHLLIVDRLFVSVGYTR